MSDFSLPAWFHRSDSSTRHHFGYSHRATKRGLSKVEHVAFQAAGLLIIAIAILLGSLVDEYFWLFLIALVPYYAYWYSLLEKENRLAFMESSVAEMNAARAQQHNRSLPDINNLGPQYQENPEIESPRGFGTHPSDSISNTKKAIQQTDEIVDDAAGETTGGYEDVIDDVNINNENTEVVNNLPLNIVENNQRKHGQNEDSATIVVPPEEQQPNNFEFEDEEGDDEDFGFEFGGEE